MSVALKNVVIFVTDLEKAKDFYVELLGLPLGGESQMMMEFFPAAGTTLGISLALTDEARALVGRHTGISLRLENIDAVCRKLAESGARFVEPLEKSPWGKMAVVADADGNQLAVVDR